jgi:sialic acid synthase
MAARVSLRMTKRRRGSGGHPSVPLTFGRRRVRPRGVWGLGGSSRSVLGRLRQYHRTVRELRIGDRRIADDGDVYVIAEIGHNHQGSVERAKELFHAAHDCGVDAVKLQKRDNRTLFTRELYDQPYDNENSFGATYGEHREALELGRDAYVELRSYALELGLGFFATAFDEPSADFLAELDVPAFKVASGDLTNTPLLRHVASFGKPVIVSTGGATIEDVDRAVDVVGATGAPLCLLQCTAAYPASVEDLNLQVIATLRDRYPETVVGLSDHQDGIAMSLVAYMLGARVIEKHFTLSHTSKGTDHAFSLMPEGMRKLVRDLRRVPDALGDGVKRPLAIEEKPLQKMGKRLVAARPLPLGHELSEGDLTARSPADGGLPPYELELLLGRRLVRPLDADEPIGRGDVEPVSATAANAAQGGA